MQCRRPPYGSAGAPANAYLGAAGGDALSPGWGTGTSQAGLKLVPVLPRTGANGRPRGRARGRGGGRSYSPGSYYEPGLLLRFFLALFRV